MLRALSALLVVCFVVACSSPRNQDGMLKSSGVEAVYSVLGPVGIEERRRLEAQIRSHEARSERGFASACDRIISRSECARQMGVVDYFSRRLLEFHGSRLGTAYADVPDLGKRDVAKRVEEDAIVARFIDRDEAQWEGFRAKLKQLKDDINVQSRLGWQVQDQEKLARAEVVFTEAILVTRDRQRAEAQRNAYIESGRMFSFPVSEAGPAVAGAVTRAPIRAIGAAGVQWIDGDKERVVDRAAVIIAVDQYTVPSWNLAFAPKNADTIAVSLQTACGMPASAIERLSGQLANSSTIESAIHRAAHRIRSSAGLLVVYLTGHGGVDAAGVPYFFTCLTERAAGNAFSRTVSRNDLVAWISAAQVEAEARGSRFSPLLVVDACRTNTMAPPPRTSITPVAAWELYSTRSGNFAEAPTDGAASPFTAALSRTLDVFARQNRAADLDTIYGEVEVLTAANTGGVQRPELIRPGDATAAPMLVSLGGVHFALQVNDPSGIPVPGAWVQFGDQPPLVLSKSAEIEVLPIVHRVVIGAPGFTKLETDLAVTRGHHGRTAVFSLCPLP